jgi:Fe-S oxidoreductase
MSRNIGKAAVKVLETLGFGSYPCSVGRKCCGRPAFSQGNLEKSVTIGALTILPC